MLCKRWWWNNDHRNRKTITTSVNFCTQRQRKWNALQKGLPWAYNSIFLCVYGCVYQSNAICWVLLTTLSHPAIRRICCCCCCCCSFSFTRHQRSPTYFILKCSLFVVNVVVVALSLKNVLHPNYSFQRIKFWFKLVSRLCFFLLSVYSY